MSTVSLSLPSDGDTIDASDVNTPFNAIVAVVNGNIDSTNVAAGGLTPANLVSGTGTSWGWQSWTPTLTNWTIGTGGSAGTTAKYIQIGKTVHFYIRSTLGSSGQSVGNNANFTLPVTASSFYGTGSNPIGTMYDSNNDWGIVVAVASTSTANLIFGVSSGSYVQASGTTSSVPFSWAAGSYFSASGTFEAA